MNLLVWKNGLFMYLLQTYIGTAWATPVSQKTSHVETKTSRHSTATKVSTAVSSKTPGPSSSLHPTTYGLGHEYNATNFFDEFVFFTAPDPSHGTVQYQSKENAMKLGLATTKDTSVRGPNGQKQSVVHLAAESGTLSTSFVGRPSIRVSSRQKYTQGLFVADFTHLPVAECGIWPAFWTSAVDTWPNGGEIDIIEGINLQTVNEIVMHTGGKCSMESDNDKMTGAQGSPNCQDSGGCSIKDQSSNSYGEGFNKGGGGVYAMAWTEKSIKLWWWSRDGIPTDVNEGRPDPESWPEPVASYTNGGCDIDKLFRDHQIVFDITFCGDWAGGNGYWGDQCAAKYGPTCSTHVMNSKDGFKDSYWEILSVKVYQKN